MNIQPFKNKIWLASPTMHGDELKYVTEAYETNWMSTVGKNINEVDEPNIGKSAYIPEWIDSEVEGINYRLNTTYKIQDDIRKWNKVNVKYVEKYTNKSLTGTEILQDEDGDNIYFYSERMPNEL